MSVSSLRVLVVDDEPDASAALELLLKPRGFDVRLAATGDEGRAMVAAWRPHVVLLDLMLPDVRDLDLLKDFRQKAPEMQVVMVTSVRQHPQGGRGDERRRVQLRREAGRREAPVALLDKAGERVALRPENRRLRRRCRTTRRSPTWSRRAT